MFQIVLHVRSCICLSTSCFELHYLCVLVFACQLHISNCTVCAFLRLLVNFMFWIALCVRSCVCFMFMLVSFMFLLTCVHVRVNSPNFGAYEWRHHDHEANLPCQTRMSDKLGTTHASEREDRKSRHATIAISFCVGSTLNKALFLSSVSSVYASFMIPLYFLASYGP